MTAGAGQQSRSVSSMWLLHPLSVEMIELNRSLSWSTLMPNSGKTSATTGGPPLLLAHADVATCTARREDRMMLWLLATLSVVTISWGIAHRLKAGSPAANCTGERCSCRLDDRA